MKKGIEKIEIIQELSETYMQICLEEERDTFGNDLLKHNNIKGLLAAEIHNVDQMPRYLYPIGDMVTVREYFQEKEFESAKLGRLLKQLVELLNLAPEFFLSEKNYLLNPHYMFYDKNQEQLYIAYLDDYGEEVGRGIGKLLESFMNQMNHHDKELVFLVYGLHKICMEEHFNLIQFAEFIGESEEEKTEKYHQSQMLEEKQEREHRLPRELSYSSQTTHIPDSCTVKRSTYDFGDNKKTLLSLGAAVVFIMLIWKTGLVHKPVSGEPDFLKVMVLILVSFGVVGFFLQKDKGKNLGDNKNENHEDETTRLVGPEDLTVVLTKQETRGVMVNLIPEDWHRTEIRIRKAPFYIGKDAEKTDEVIQEREISRIHVKVVAEESHVYLIDEESTNGTYINGKRLNPWERHRINDGDRIGIASVFYTVEIPS